MDFSKIIIFICLVLIGFLLYGEHKFERKCNKLNGKYKVLSEYSSVCLKNGKIIDIL